MRSPPLPHAPLAPPCRGWPHADRAAHHDPRPHGRHPRTARRVHERAQAHLPVRTPHLGRAPRAARDRAAADAHLRRTGDAHEAPTHSTETTNPDYYVNEAGTEYQYGTSSAEKGKLVTESGGAIAKEPAEWKERKCSEKVGACEWEDGSLKGYVYDFVTWQKDPNCKNFETSYKRLTVVVTVKVPSGSRPVAATRVSTLVVNPKETKAGIEAC